MMTEAQREEGIRVMTEREMSDRTRQDGEEYRVRVLTKTKNLLGGARSETTKLIYYPPTEGDRARAAFDWYIRDPHRPVVTLYHGLVVLNHHDPERAER